MSDAVPRPRRETLGDLLDEIAAATPRSLAVVFHDKRVDYAALKGDAVFARLVEEVVELSERLDRKRAGRFQKHLADAGP